MSISNLFNVPNTRDLFADSLIITGSNPLKTPTLDVTGNVLFRNPINFGSTVDSTSASTGAITISGGMGVAGNFTVGGTLTADKIVYITSETIAGPNSTSTDTGALVLQGGLGMSQDAYIGGLLNVTGNITAGSETITNDLHVGGTIYGSFSSSTNDSTSTSTGALVISGGLGVAKKLYVGSNISAPTMTLTGGNTTTVSTAGDLVISGGVGIGNNLIVGGNTNISGISTLKATQVTSTTESTSSASGSMIISGGVGVAKNLYVGGNAIINGFTSMDSINILGVAESTTTSTGSIVTLGGLGVAGNANIGGMFSVNSLASFGLIDCMDTTESTSVSLGSITIAGGVGIAKNLNVGGNLNVTGQLTPQNVKYPSLPSSNWFLLYQTLVSDNQIVNSVLRTPANNLIEILVNGSTYNSNLDNFTLTNMPRFIVYNDSTYIYIYGQSVTSSTIQTLYSDVLLTLSDKGSGTYPSDQSGTTNLVYDTSNFAFYINNDKVLMTDATLSNSLSTGSLILTGGLAVGNNANVANSMSVISSTNALNNFTASIDVPGNAVLNSGNNQINFASNNQIKVQKTGNVAATNLGTAPFYSYGGISSLLYTRSSGAYVHNIGNQTLYGGMSTDANNNLNLQSYSGINNVIPPNYAFYVSGASVNADYSAGTYTLVGTPTATGVSIVSNQIYLSLPSSQVKWNTGTPYVDAGTTGCVRLSFTPAYTGPPSATVQIFETYYSPTNNLSEMLLYHNTSGHLKLEVYPDGGLTPLFDADLGLWSQTSGTTYEIEVDWTASNQYVFINGNQFGATLSYSMSTRTHGSYILINNGSGTATGYWSNIMMFLAPQHTSNYTPVPVGWISTRSDVNGLTIYNYVNNSNSALLYVDSSGFLNLGTPFTVASTINSNYLHSQTGTYASLNDSTSVVTGALIVDGGEGIAKNLYVGGIVNIQSTTDSTNSLTGSLIVGGGSAIQKNLYVGGNVNILSTIDSTTSSTGALMISGGVNISKNLMVSGNLYSYNATANKSGGVYSDTSGNLILISGSGITQYHSSTTQVKLLSTIDATSPTNGSLNVTGGVGIRKSLCVGSTNNSTSTSTGALQVTGGVGIAGNLTVGGTINGTLTATSLTTLTVTNTNNATDTQTGSLIVAGGSSVAKDLRVGGIVYATGGFISNNVVGYMATWGYQGGTFVQQMNNIINVNDNSVFLSLPNVNFTPTSNSTHLILGTALPSNLKPFTVRMFALEIFNDGQFIPAVLQLNPGFNTITITTIGDYANALTSISFDVCYNIIS